MTTVTEQDLADYDSMTPAEKQEFAGKISEETATAFADALDARDHAKAPKKDPGAGSVLPMAQVPFAPDTAAPGQNQATTEEPAPIGTADRAFAQNFRNTPADKLSYLKARYPKMDFESRRATSGDPVADASARAFAKEGGENTERLYAKPMGAAQAPWQAVSPKGDMAGEALDNAVPIASGIVSGAAGARAGVGAASLLKGFGEGASGFLPMVQRALARFAPLAAAGAASGTANVGLEAGRELAGNAAPGTPPQAVDPEKLAGQFAAGYATPLLFGTGASPGMAAEAKVPMANQRGLPSRGFSLLTTGAGSLFSGIPRHEITNAMEKLPEVRAIESQGQAGVIKKIQDTTDALRDGLYKHQDQLGRQIADVLSSTTKGVNVAPARAELKSEIEKIGALRGTPRWNNDIEGQYKALNERYQNLFMSKKPAVPAPAAPAGPTLFGANGQPLPGPPVAEAQPERWVDLPDELDTQGRKTGRVLVDPHHAMQIRRSLQDMANFGTMNPNNVNARGGNNSLSQFDKDAQRFGTNAYKHISNALDDATKEAGNTLGTGSFKELNGKYATLKETQNYLKALTDDGMKADDKAGKILMSLGAPSNANMRYTLQQLDKDLNTSVVPSADTLRALSIFGKANARGVAQSSFGSTATEKGNRARVLGAAAAGALAHLLAPENHELTGLAAMGGGAVAAPFASPAALRNYMNIGRLPRAAADAVGGGFGLGLRPLHTYSSQFLLPGALPSAWQSMKDQQP